MNDPCETLIRDALRDSNVRFVEERHPGNKAGLDFFLFDQDVYIEVKQFHSSRIADQMGRAENVIVAQGRKACELLADIIRSWA